MNKQALKKHHFWVLTGLVPLIVLIAFLLITSGVGGAIENHQAALDKAKNELGARKSIKPESLIKDLNSQVDELKKKKGEMWKKNWEKQKDQFTWLPSPRLQDFKSRDLAFGDSIPNDNSQRDVFKDPAVYEAEFARMAASVAPTQFLGDAGSKEPAWRKVLRFVSAWDARVPQSEWIWLAMEDIWIQRTLLSAVKSVNEQIATFTKPAHDTGASTPEPHYKCSSRLWEVELWLERQGNDNVIRGKLKNNTDRLQILGVGNTMRLQIWLTNSNLEDESRAVEFPIEGELVRARAFAQATDTDKAPVIKELPAHRIKAGTPANGIFKVRQKFDVRTVPIRMIEELRLNEKDARHGPKVLAPLRVDKKDEPAADATGKGPATPAGATPSSTTAAASPGGGNVESALLANKSRYLVVTQQVRRMPVMMRVVLDQMFVEDFLVALANMPLRFQTTQVDWTRFRGSLPSTGDPASSGPRSSDGSDAPVQRTGETVQGSGFTGLGDPYRGAIRNPSKSPSPTPASPQASSVSEGQLTAGLVSVSAYGIISMYMKYTEDSAKDVKTEAPPRPSPSPKKSSTQGEP